MKTRRLLRLIKIYSIFLFFLFFVTSLKAENLSGKKVFCENSSENFFVVFKENNKADFTWANFAFAEAGIDMFQQTEEAYEFQNILGDKAVSVGPLMISRTELRLITMSGYNGKCKLVNKDLSMKIKKKFYKILSKHNKKKKLKF